MIFKSILKVLNTAFGMVLRIVLIIALCFISAWCTGYILTMPFVWGGLIRLGVIAVCILLIRWLLILGREKDDPVPPDHPD